MTPLPTDAERLEALSRRYSPDSFRIRELESGRWAVYGPDHDLLGCVEDFEGVRALTTHLRAAAAIGRERLAAELAASARRAADRAEIEALDLSDLEIDI